MSSSICWAKIDIRKRHRYAFQRSIVDSHGREEYVIRIPGFYGELRKSMTPKEFASFVEANNKATYKAVVKAASMNGERGFSTKGFSQGGMNDIMISALSKMLEPKQRDKVKDEDNRNLR